MGVSAGPPNLDAVRAVRGAVGRAVAAVVYIAERERAVAAARVVRDEAIAEALTEEGPAAVWRAMCAVDPEVGEHLSLSSVRQVRYWRGRG